MKQLLATIFLIFLNVMLFAHPWKPNHFVIIDTDGGFDDFRAINLLLASPDVRVLAITASDGVLDAEQVYKKVKSLICELHHEGILTGMLDDSANRVKNCQPALDFSWGCLIGDQIHVPSSIEIVDYILKNTREKITFISLGGLGTVAACLNELDSFKLRTKRIIWAGDGQMNDENFNYTINPASFLSITENQAIPLHIVNGNIGKAVYNQQFMETVYSINNSCATNIVRSLQQASTPYALHWYDETIALYLHFPDFFVTDTSPTFFSHNFLLQAISELPVLVQQILSGRITNQNQVLSYFPLDTLFYQEDVRSIITKTISRYGTEEWVATVLTNELHRHLGVYATIGVKMGIRAREFFGAGVDEMQITSFAGLNPPFSCMNDGLQVSTGATLGHGLIQAKPESNPVPKAEFEYLGQKITIALKDEYRNKIASEIHDLNAIYGLNSNIYWELVRQLALYYWAEWDRNVIFEIQYTQGNF